MILQALHEYALKEGLGGSPELEEARVAYKFIISKEGNLLEIQEMRDGKRPQSMEGAFKAAGNTASVDGQYINWLTETIGRTIPGMEDPSKAVDVKKQLRLLGLTREAALETHDDSLQAVLKFLESLHSNPEEADRVRSQLSELKAKGTDRITFADPENPFGSLLIQREPIREFWKRFYSTAISSKIKTQGRGQCLITGKQGVPMAKGHNALAISSDRPILACFDKDAYKSYGWKDAEHCPVSQEAMEAYCAAFEKLATDPEYHYPILKKIGGQYVECMRFIFWTKKGLPPGFNSLWGGGDFTDIKMVKNLFQQTWKGKEGTIEDTEPFHCFAYSVNKKRLMLRSVNTLTVREVRHNLEEWNERITVKLPPFMDQYRFYKNHEERVMIAAREELSVPPLIWEIQTAISHDPNDVPDRLIPMIINALLLGCPLPTSLLPMALARQRLAEGLDRLNVNRIGIIRCALNDFLKRQKKGEKLMKSDLDETNDTAAYRLGRLLAVYENIQQMKARNQSDTLNVTLTDRYFSAACSSPGVVFPTLEKLVRKLLQQIRNRGKVGLVIYFERLIAEILQSVPEIPKQLNMYDQSRFILGFYHEKSRPKKEQPEVEEDTVE